jgi:hypothetical protein
MPKCWNSLFFRQALRGDECGIAGAGVAIRPTRHVGNLLPTGRLTASVGYGRPIPGTERRLDDGGFNGSMQHTRGCVSRRSVADEAKTEDFSLRLARAL